MESIQYLASEKEKRYKIRAYHQVAVRFKKPYLMITIKILKLVLTKYLFSIVYLNSVL